jgi:hypothetical protein
VTYVLSYDSERINDIFDRSDVDCQYLRKIVNYRIKIPAIDRDIVKKRFSECIENIAQIYGTKDKLDSKGHVFKFLCNQINDLRDFKLIINNVISYTYFEKKQKLYIEDLIAINYIKFFNYNLYLEILKEKDYFIKYDNTNNDEYYSIETQENADVKKEKYFNNLFENTENEKYKLLLAEIFPSLDKIVGKIKLNSINDNTEYKDIIYNKRISSGRFFDMYFTYINSNEYIKTLEILKEFIDKINQEENINNHEDIFFATLGRLDEEFGQEIYQQYFNYLQLFVENLNEEVQYSLLKIIFFDFYKIYNMNTDKGYGVYSNLVYIIHEILQKIQDKYFDEFLNKIKNEYGKLLIIRDVKKHLEGQQFNETLVGRYNAIKNTYEEMGNEILNKNINLYDESYYHPKNIWGLSDIIASKNDINFRDYTEGIVNDRNIYRLLYDAMSTFGSDDISYAIQKSMLEKFISEEAADKLLSHAKPKTETEEFILEIYKAYKNKTNENESGGLKNYRNIYLTL